MGKGAYRGPWMFETTAREMAIDVRRPAGRARPDRAPPEEPAARRRAPVHHPGRRGVAGDHAARDARAGARRCSTSTRSEPSRPRPAPTGRLLGLGVSVLRRADLHGRADVGDRRAATIRVESSGQGRGLSWARRRTARASRRRWPRSSPTPSASTTTTSPSSRPTPSRRPTAPAPVAAGRRSSPAGAAPRRVGRRARQGAGRSPPTRWRPAPTTSRSATASSRCSGTPRRSMTLRELATVAYRTAETLPPELDAGLEATVRFRPSRFPTWSNATHVCVVEIDADDVAAPRSCATSCPRTAGA